jgi:hypothetical protein
MTEMVAQVRKGLDLLSGVPDGAARREQELDLQITLGRALIATKGVAAPEPGEAFARAPQLRDQLNHPQQLGPVLLGQFLSRLVRGELDRAEPEEMRHLGEARMLRSAEKVIAISREQDFPMYVGVGNITRAGVHAQWDT